MKNFILSIWLLSLFLSNALASEKTLCEEPKNQCTFVLLSERSGKYKIVNDVRADQRFPPFSTYKIPNSLIALETGVVRDLKQDLTFDKSKYPIQSWWPEKWYSAPLNLHKAFNYSAVPVYQEIASKIGDKRMKLYIRHFEYGNGDISSGIDRFWLNGSLKISAKEQVAFIQRMYKSELPVSEKSLSLLKKIMLVEESSDYKLYVKTGGGSTGKASAIGWYVGFVEKGSGVYYFALNMAGVSFSAIQQKRIDLAKSYLKQAGVL